MTKSLFRSGSHGWRFSVCAVALLIAIQILSARAQAQGEGPRVYLLAPVDFNAVSVTYMDMSSNMNFAGNILIPEAKVNSDVYAVNYNRFFSIGDRFSELWVTGVFGSVDGQVNGTPLGTLSTEESGSGDPYIALRVGLIGAPALQPADFVQHQQSFQMYALAGLSLDAGDYSSTRVLNLGTGRSSLRLGVPMVIPFGRQSNTTWLEINPNVYLYEDNNDPFNASLREQEPLFVLETHLTHNVTRRFWVGVDLRYQTGGETTTDGVDDNNRLSQLGGGVSAGYQITRALSGFISYGEIIEKSDNSEGDMLRARLIYTF